METFPHRLECKEAKLISRAAFKFYTSLHTSAYSNVECSSFFDKVQNYMTKINEPIREMCERDLEIEELNAMLQRLPLKQAPRFQWSHI